MLEKFNRITESFFLTALGCYLAYAAISATTFQLPLPAKTLYVLFFLLGIGAFGRFLVNTADLVREKNRERMFCYFLAVFFAIVCVLCYHSMHSGYLLLLGAAAVGSVGISYQKLLKTYLLSAGVVLAVTVLAALGGFITNYVQLKEGHLRSSWGTGYPTDFASWVLYTMMFLWLSLRRCPRILQPVFACVSFLIACFIAYAVNSVVCSALFFTAILVIIGKDRIALPGVMKRMSRGLLIGAFPIMGAVMFTLMGLYFHKNTLAYTFDSFLHSRVSLAAAAFQEYGITAFGKAFEMYGFGFSQYAPSSYNFVDSSYPLILLRYGAVFLAVAAVLWMSSTARALRKKNWKLALVLALIAVHGFMEHHFTELNFNILLLAAFSVQAADHLVMFGIVPSLEELSAQHLRQHGGVGVHGGLYVLQRLHHLGTCADTESHYRKSEHRCQGGNQNRSHSGLACLNNRLSALRTLKPEVVDIVNKHDTVVNNDTAEHYKAYQRNHTDVKARNQKSDKSAGEGKRNGEHNDER